MPRNPARCMWEKHPHARGEDRSSWWTTTTPTETPPRPWGRQFQTISANIRLGNTPTPVGKTQSDQHIDQIKRKHPHARGEDSKCNPYILADKETPPRPWGRRWAVIIRSQRVRNTPTPVGKTPGACCEARDLGKHPHARGEDPLSSIWKKSTAETPPRPWGRHQQIVKDHPLTCNILGLMVVKGFDNQLQSADCRQRLFCWSDGSDFITRWAWQGTEYDNARLRRAMFVKVINHVDGN